MGRIDLLYPAQTPNSTALIESLTMLSNPIALSANTIAVGKTVLPIYQFSRTEYAFSLRAILHFLNIKHRNFSQKLEPFIGINTQTGLPEKFISIDENFVSFLAELSQKKHHPQAMAMLGIFSMHGFKDYLRNQFYAVDDNQHPAISDTAFQVQPLSNITDADKSSIELKLDADEIVETELPFLDHLQSIKQRNQRLLNLLDEWSANPDYELDCTWDEVMANL
ncbi:hypothetical protein AMR42_11965 [Limnothrix sp. PR1529]|uniref:hypothetical protein n=1 Tax=Limnothrix sp. PR1529 TaxID=1704291 RepID=UPI00081DE284|nr:hypothetical protein [Limnothrix sp. PR1529]OCQ90756.1 hypothetical protein BCR12_03395 [Limnothrix sp. P13C2]PIB09875.1 hypothetical protein AMR42_11965 [Limnothrix sp. PR1529]